MLFRLPSVLYRAGLGALLGHRFLVLAHRGRRTGRLHRTPIEVVAYDRESGEAMAISAWGECADWYRNLRAGSPAEVWLGASRFAAEVRFLDHSETVDLLLDFRRRHPLEARLARPILGWTLTGSEAEIERLAGRLRAVAFRPRT
jgi:deazaflavin-dependent oxidoreductase (nitroreductase family)